MRRGSLNLRLSGGEVDGVDGELYDLVTLGREGVDDAADAGIVRFREIGTAELSVSLPVRVGVDHALATCQLTKLTTG